MALSGTAMPSLAAVARSYLIESGSGALRQRIEGYSVLVKDIMSGGETSNARSLTNVNGTLLFAADDGTPGGRKLWKSDGTEEGTMLVKSRPDVTTSASELTDVNGTLFFVHGMELWKAER